MATDRYKRCKTWPVTLASGMDKGPLADRIVEAFDGLSAQLRAAARFVLEHPRDVALLSMREQARRAGLQPATMTRLAQHLGLPGYDAVRELHADALRGAAAGGTGGAGAPVSRQALKGDRSLAADMLAASVRHLESLSTPAGIEALAAAGKALAKARRIYVMGQRTGFPVAFQLHAHLRLVGRKAHLLDGPGGTGTDALAVGDREDVLVAISVEPHLRHVLDVAALAVSRGIPVIAITDSAVSPLARKARHSIVVTSEGASILPAMGPALVVAEILAAIVAGRGGDKALSALRKIDAHHVALGTHGKSATARQPAPQAGPPARAPRQDPVPVDGMTSVGTLSGKTAPRVSDK